MIFCLLFSDQNRSSTDSTKVEIAYDFVCVWEFTIGNMIINNQRQVGLTTFTDRKSDILL